MKINVLRKARYEGTFIYIFQFHNIFQYLFAAEGEIYRNDIVLNPNPLTWILYWLRLAPLYSTDELDTGEGIILSGAMRSIDKMIKEGKFSRPEKRREKKRMTKCLWQARHGGEKGEERFWVCVTHGEVVKMEDGVKPKHD